MQNRFFILTISFLLFFTQQLPGVEAPDLRIISLVPSQTELLFAMGFEKNIVGVSDYCNFPPEAQTKEKIGDMELKIERIMLLRPTILVDVNNMHKKYEPLFRQLGLNYVNFSLTRLEYLPKVALELAEILGAKEKGEVFVDHWNSKTSSMELPAPANKIKVYMEIWDTPMQAAGKNSYIGDMISKAGGTNVFQDSNDFPVVNSENIISSNPDVILVAYPLPDLKSISNRPGWKNLNAVKNKQIYPLDQDLYVRPGPRNVDGLKNLNRIFRQIH